MTSNILSIHQLRNDTQGPYSIDILECECVVITGESGAGKSLLLRMIADLIPNQGTVSINQQDREQLTASHWRRQVTYVGSESGWWAKTVQEHFNHLEFIKPLLPQLNLKESLLTSDISQLSTGEKQRFALLRALSPEVKFLLLDEVTSALDPQSVLLVEALICQLQEQGIGVLLVSHNMEQVRRLATKHYHLTTNTLERRI